MEHTCQYCSKPFLPKRTDSRYCSHSCRQMAYVLRKVNGDDLSNTLSETNEPSSEQLPANEELMGNPVSEQQANEIPVNSRSKGVSVKTTKLPRPVKDDAKYEEYSSRYMEELWYLHEESNSWLALSELFTGKNQPCIWISERFRCLIECLLTLSEMKNVEANDLKELCNAFTRVIRSRYFEGFSGSYPYTEDILELRELLKRACINAGEKEQIRFRLSRNQKQNLIVTRYELSEFVPKKSFSELNFNS